MINIASISLDHLDNRQRQLLAKLGLVPTRPGDWTMDILEVANELLPPLSSDGQEAAGDSIFTIHAITKRHIDGANPTAKGWIAEDEAQAAERQRDGRPSYLEEFSSLFGYRAACVNLASKMGSGIVNAHLLQSAETGRWSRGLYVSSAFLPHRFLTAPVVRYVTEEYVSRILGAEKRGLVLNETTGIIGFGALSGSRLYANRIPSSPRWKKRWQRTLGNFATGGAVVQRLLPALVAKQEQLGRKPTVLVVGATGSTGMVVSALLADTVPLDLVLCSRTEDDLKELAARLTQRTPDTTVRWCTADRLEQIVPQADVVVYLVSDPSLKVPSHLYAKGKSVLVIDAARPRCHDQSFPEERPDLVITDGPTILMTHGEVVYDELFDLYIHELLCCMAETAYRAVAGDYENCLPPSRVAEFNQPAVITAATILLSRMAKHGLIVAPHDRWHRQVFDQIERLRTLAA